MADWPPSLKPIGKYMVRAGQVQPSQPIVAYYCNYYALKRAIELRDQSDEKANGLIRVLLDKCEEAKAEIGDDDGSHRGIVEEFALSVFDRADMEDRADRATKETAQTFYASVCFFEVCNVFGPLADDLNQRLRYARWKAVDISKALKEGRRPLPGAPGEAEALEEQRQVAEAEKAAASAPTADTGEDSDAKQESEGAYPQTSQRVPPAPPLREYDSDLHEYQPQPLQRERSESAGQYPTVAPPYPSTDISPLAQQDPYPSNARDKSVYPTMNSAYPTDGPHTNSNSAYPQESGYAAPSAPYIPQASAPYVTEESSYPQPSKSAPMPAIPSLQLPGIGTNLGDPPASQPLRHDPALLPPRSDAVHVPPQSQPPYVQPRSDPGFTAARSDPAYPPPGSGLGYPPRSNAPEHQLPGSMPLQAPMRTAQPPAAPARTGAALSNYKPSIKDTQEAQRLAKYAASALDFQDLKTAVSNLEEALNLLKGKQ